jgi:signal transduction histidine kinase
MPCHAGMQTCLYEISTGSNWSLTLSFGHGSTRPETVSPLSPSDAAFIAALGQILELGLKQTVGYRTSVVAMAHELGQALLGLGGVVTFIQRELNATDPKSLHRFEKHKAKLNLALAESRLGIYVIRNFLAHHSPFELAKLGPRSTTSVDLRAVLEEMLELHTFVAQSKGIAFEVNLPSHLPPVRYDEMEIRRLLHNILGNAIKYSYRTVQTAQRSVNVTARVPYDPGFRTRRFAILVENYGMGLQEGERVRIGTAGVRGTRARREVPVGSGIGLSQARQIMHALGGEVRMNFKRLYLDESGAPVDLVTAQLIFPY